MKITERDILIRLSEQPVTSLLELPAMLQPTAEEIVETLGLDKKLHPDYKDALYNEKLIVANAFVLAKLSMVEQILAYPSALTLSPSEFAALVHHYLKVKDATKRGRST